MYALVRTTIPPIPFDIFLTSGSDAQLRSRGEKDWSITSRSAPPLS